MRIGWIALGLLFVAGCARGITEKRSPSPAPGGGTPRGPTPSLATPAGKGTPAGGDVLTFEGAVEAVLPGGYQVAGHRVQVAPDIDAEGPLPPGVYVTVIGTRAPDGSIVAESFEVLRRSEGEGEWEGILQEALPHGYRVDGRRVLVLPTTIVIGTPQVGLDVYVSGFEQPDGSILADTVIVVESP